MNRNSFKKKFFSRQRFFGWLGICLFLFTLIDATVLQAFGGNEALGIESYAQAFAKTQPEINTSVANFNELAAAALARSTPDQPLKVPSHHCECICSCAHFLTSNRFVEPFGNAVAFFNRQVHVSFPKSPSSESYLSSLFRPPRLA